MTSKKKAGAVVAGKRLGILGAGQLSALLADAATSLGLKVRVLAENPEEPATQIKGVELVVGNSRLPKDSLAFFEGLDALTFENEFIPSVELDILLELHPNLKIGPSLAIMGLLQDKIAQKEILDHLGIANAPYIVYDPRTEKPTEFIKRLRTELEGGFVLKWARWGYDGKGNYFFDNRGSVQRAEQFMHEGLRKGSRIFAEKKIRFVKELAIIAAHCNLRQEFVAYPLVESVQEKGVCRKVVGPVLKMGFSESLAKKANQIAFQIAKHLEISGLFAIEFFLDANDQLIVNEMAPRVHNTGHYTLSVNAPSQFENHVRAVMGMELLPCLIEDRFIMWNLLGPEGILPKRLDSWKLPEAPKGIDVFWYGKKELRSGRKMGHLGASGKTDRGLKKLEREMQDYEKKIWNSIGVKSVKI
jgi:5-(carboxyamino)imidazole ribonucleotide synthase